MNLSALLLITLSGNGYWLGGHTETMEVGWAVKQPIPNATLAWRLVCGDAELAAGRLALPAQRRSGVVRLGVPRVRVQTAMQLIYGVELPGKPAPIARGAAAVEVYPDDLLAGLAQRMAGKQLLVWDLPDGLPAVLKRSDVKHTAIAGDAELQFVRPDVVLVGADRLGTEMQGQTKLLNLARAGASVLVFRQTQPAALAGYRLSRRTAPAEWAWREDHPLARQRRLWTASDRGPEAWAVRLPADEPALEIAWWPREVAGKRPAPVDALIVSKTLDKGRIVLCQMPLGPWQSDPRSQLFLVDALDYLASPVVPTPPPSRRPRGVQAAPAAAAPSIVFP
jgi:hypothetical protein